jgi:hypothetical protein
MKDNQNLLRLTSEQRQDFQQWVQSQTLPAGDVFRGRLIAARADGASYRKIDENSMRENKTTG